jgi:hypothetical protein
MSQLTFRGLPGGPSGPCPEPGSLFDRTFNPKGLPAQGHRAKPSVRHDLLLDEVARLSTELHGLQGVSVTADCVGSLFRPWLSELKFQHLPDEVEIVSVEGNQCCANFSAGGG